MQEKLLNKNKTELERLIELRARYYNDLVQKLTILHQQKKTIINSYRHVVAEIDEKIERINPGRIPGGDKNGKKDNKKRICK